MIEHRFTFHEYTILITIPFVDDKYLPKFRCGYVGVPKGHPAYAKSTYDLRNIDVHGGVTFTGSRPEEMDSWFIGFDCGHVGDSPVLWTANKVSYECGRLIKQLENMKTKEVPVVRIDDDDYRSIELD